MNHQTDDLQSPTCHGPVKRLKGCAFVLLIMSNLLLGFSVLGQTSYIADAWWSYQQDCNGDGCWAGTMPGNLARLSWEPDVINCNGTLTVYEKIYTRACGTIPWSPVF